MLNNRKLKIGAEMDIKDNYGITVWEYDHLLLQLVQRFGKIIKEFIGLDMDPIRSLQKSLIG